MSPNNNNGNNKQQPQAKDRACGEEDTRRRRGVFENLFGLRRGRLKSNKDEEKGPADKTHWEDEKRAAGKEKKWVAKEVKHVLKSGVLEKIIRMYMEDVILKTGPMRSFLESVMEEKWTELVHTKGGKATGDGAGEWNDCEV
jgi:hypothetical protein